MNANLAHLLERALAVPDRALYRHSTGGAWKDVTAAEVAALAGRYNPQAVLANDPELARVLASISDGRYSDGDRGLFEPLVRNLIEKDPFFVLADFRAYADAQRRVARAWKDPDRWTRTSILNVAAMGRFSSDRSIREYARDVWKVSPVIVRSPDSPSVRPPRS